MNNSSNLNATKKVKYRDLSRGKLLTSLTSSKSYLLEVCGNLDLGKKAILDYYSTLRNSQKASTITFIPRSETLNQFKEFVRILTEISEEDYALMLHSSKKYKHENKYDFFYYISEKLKSRGLFKAKTIFILDCQLFDQYTRDFIQYICSYWKGINLKIVSLSSEYMFAFSNKYSLENDDKMMIAPSEKPEYQDYQNYILSINEIESYNLVHERMQENYYNYDLFKEAINDLKIINDSEGLITIYFYLLELSEIKNSPLKKLKVLNELGKTYISINDSTDAIDVFKEYITLSDKLRVDPANKDIIKRYAKDLNCSLQSVVFNLATALLATNSMNFALEIIDELSLKHNDEYFESCKIWKYKILILKSEILTYKEEFDAASEILDQVTTKLFEDYNNNKLLLEKSDEILFSYYDFDIREIIAEVKKHYGKLNYYINDFDKAEDYFNDALSYYKSSDNKFGQAAVYNNIGVLYQLKGEYSNAEDMYKKSLDLEKELYSLNGISISYSNLGGLMDDLGNRKRSLHYLNLAIELQKLLNDPYQITNIYNNIGVTYMDEKDYDNSEKAFQKTLEIALNFNFQKVLIPTYNNFGALYNAKGEWDKAIEYHNKAIDKCGEYDDVDGMVISYSNLGEIYEKRGKLDLAYDLFAKAEKFLERVSDENIKADLNGNIGSVLTKLNRFKEAYSYLVESLDFFKTVDAKHKIVEGYQKLSSYFIYTHNYESAEYHLKEALNLAESLSLTNALGRSYYLMAVLEIEVYHSLVKERNDVSDKEIDSYKDVELKKKIPTIVKNLRKAIEYFLASSKQYELAQANYLLAKILAEDSRWETALEILINNENSIKKFGAIKLLEQNDILKQRIIKSHIVEVESNKSLEQLSNRFYEVTNKLGLITNIDELMEVASEELIQFADADSLLFYLYCKNESANVHLVSNFLDENGKQKEVIEEPKQEDKDKDEFAEEIFPTPKVKEVKHWQYKKTVNFDCHSKYYDSLMDVLQKCYDKNEKLDYKQPVFAPIYNHVIALPLSLRNKAQGVVVFMVEHASKYFQEKVINMISALCNQIIVLIENIKTSDLEKSHAAIRTKLTEQNPYNIIGKSEPIQKIFRLIDKVKDTPTTVLVEGPSGTGKELIARAIHYGSVRRNKAFIAQYCGALPETLLESELFGHVKGAFTGASADKKGLLEMADGGTFFLDEIADISLSTQAKLLRFLQEGEVKRVGSTKTEKVNVRVVCATNVSLIDKVKKGEFRLDLYYRLNVIRIQVPSLLDRRDDVPLLAVYFLDRYNKHIKKNINGITDEAMIILKNYEWPGNVRQLENEMERAVTLSDDNTFITDTDLSPELVNFASNRSMINDLTRPKSLKEAVEELEIKMIKRALEENNFNQTQVAKILGLSRQGLIKKIKRYGLEK